MEVVQTKMNSMVKNANEITIMLWSLNKSSHVRIREGMARKEMIALTHLVCSQLKIAKIKVMVRNIFQVLKYKRLGL